MSSKKDHIAHELKEKLSNEKYSGSNVFELPPKTKSNKKRKRTVQKPHLRKKKWQTDPDAEQDVSDQPSESEDTQTNETENATTENTTKLNPKKKKGSSNYRIK